MFALDGYEIIHEKSPKAGIKIYSARHIRSSNRVNIYFLPINEKSFAPIDAVYKNFLPLQSLTSSHVVRVFAIQKVLKAAASGIIFVLEDTQGLPLKKYLLKNQPLDIEKFIRMAIQLVTAVNDLHKAGLTHGCLTSSTVMIDPDTGHVFINEFEFGKIPVPEPESFDRKNKERIPITKDYLPYISPEQTGRMNRDVDYRTDFYSLGIIFYELLTGKLPFTGNNPMELIHAHMARNPVLPSAVRKEINAPLSKIIMKLLSKSPEKRYQSTYGLKSDLAFCLQKNLSGVGMDTFQPARHDIPERFRLPDRMYGREIEMAMLVDEFDRISQNDLGVTMITGYSGVGKSRLVSEIQNYIVHKGGYFISGKYEPLQQDIPYSGLISAFGEIIKQVLAESTDQINNWRHQLKSALGKNAQVLIDVIPEVELIIGKQPPVLELSPTDAQNRFQMVFEKFLRVFATKEHSMTLFVDNMQWADVAGLQLMEAFFTGTKTRNFYFIGAYRNNEISERHPLFTTLKAIKNKGVPVQTITLKPISETNVCHLISDTLQENLNHVRLLSQIVHDKTRGNPFFIRQFLETLNTEGFLSYDYENGRWQWDIEQITAQSITDNVVDFMSAKVLKLSDNSQKVLQQASCIGNPFHLSLLALVAKKPSGETLADLREAIELGLILAKGDVYRHMNKLSAVIQTTEKSGLPLINPADDISFEFLHDKVMQAVYFLIPDSQKKELHLKIGKLILKNTDPADLPHQIFPIVSHFNFGKNQLTEKTDQLQLARLNLIAGKKAKDAAAYDQALNYLKTGESFLAKDSWEDHYDLTFNIKKHQMECAYLLHHFDDAENLFTVLSERAASDEDKALIYNHKMIMLAGLAKHEDALKIGATGLRLLGVKLPKRVGKLDVLNSLFTLKIKLYRKDIDNLLSLPEITDTRLLLILKMMMNISLSAYFCQPYLASYLALNIFKMTLKHGNSNVSPFAYVIYGSALCAIFKDYKTGNKFGQMALKANDKFGGPEMTAKVLLYFNNAINIWVNPIGQSMEYTRKGIKSALETGDLNYAIYHIQVLIIFMLAGGRSLNEIADECDRYFEFVEQTHDVGALNYLISVKQFIKCVTGMTWDFHSLNDDQFQEAHHIENMKKDDIKIILCRHYLIKMRLLYIVEEFDGAIAAAKQCAALRNYHMGTIIIPEYYFYHGLILAANYHQVPKIKQTWYRLRIKRFCRHLKQFAVQCAENFEDKYLLLEAEYARITGLDRQAITFYRRAIKSAKTNGFIQIHAIANEAAAKFYIAKGFDDIAATFMFRARQTYRQWGATGKIDLLEKKYPVLLAAENRVKTLPGKQHLDYSTIVKSLQMISTEIVFEDLLKNLMKIVLENAGARKVQFLTIKSNQMFLEAQHSIDSEETQVYKSLPADNRNDLFLSVLNYVKRTRTYMVMDDAGKSGDFTQHDYVLTHRPKSVLCMPVLRHSQLVALLYLENNITPAVFTPERIKVLVLLASQAAISLENARLYESVIQNEKKLRKMSAKREDDSLRYQDQLRSLSSELSLIEERERRRIATDLHDRIGHALANASMKLRVIKSELSSSAASKQIDDIHQLIDQSIQDTQTLTFELSPPILYDLGLEAALDWLAEQTQKQHGIQVAFIDDFTPKDIDESLRILLFQATRELMFNLVKHSKATRASISISKEDTFVRVMITDNGVGFEATKKKTGVKKGGFGLFSIRERLKHQGGRLEVQSDPETGSCVTLISPMTVNEPSEQENANDDTNPTRR